VKADFRRAHLSTRQAAILTFADKLSRTPWLVGPQDAADLRRAGLGDLEALHAVLGCAHFNYFNRVADGLGIALDYERTLPAVESRPAGHEAAAKGEPAGAAASAGKKGWKTMEDVFAAMTPNPEARDLARKWRAHHLRETVSLGRAARLDIGAAIAGFCGARIPLGEYQADHERPAAGGGSPPADSPFLAHALRLTGRPWTITEAHLDDLRRVGLDDRGLVELTTLASYLNFESRAAVGLEACFG
jgi:uncharacterized protein YciW